MKRVHVPIDRHADAQLTEVLIRFDALAEFLKL
jgi:hypothetical protein